MSRALRASALPTPPRPSLGASRRCYATGGSDPAEFKANKSTKKNDKMGVYLIGGITVLVAGAYATLMAAPTKVAETGHSTDRGAVEHMRPQTGTKDPKYKARTDEGVNP
ncbi:hypothetical protein S40285_10069 [Stachybotrys chlorohalonatus IBT 40285]|uniref:Uncharacterized protein n=1 Tax=Stachybotrys chlorohalonatus (strain IBT 40285) TaxID=1283841 RepID=A0A084QMD0_STAC4|nr:hypothetical protein S40285_10069 [Stachybotrys chlorohalonata IBT 40285]